MTRVRIDPDSSSDRAEEVNQLLMWFRFGMIGEPTLLASLRILRMEDPEAMVRDMKAHMVEKKRPSHEDARRIASQQYLKEKLR